MYIERESFTISGYYMLYVHHIYLNKFFCKCFVDPHNFRDVHIYMCVCFINIISTKKNGRYSNSECFIHIGEMSEVHQQMFAKRTQRKKMNQNMYIRNVYILYLYMYIYSIEINKSTACVHRAQLLYI